MADEDDLGAKMENLNITNRYLVQDKKRLEKQLEELENTNKKNEEERIQVILNIVRPLNRYLDIVESTVDPKTRALLLIDKICMLLTVGSGAGSGILINEKYTDSEELKKELKTFHEKFGVEVVNLYTAMTK